MNKLKKRSIEVRRKVIELTEKKGGGHLGGEFSEIEIMIALYDHILSKDDKFILSKGHACSPLYVLLKEQGYNPKILGHPDIDERNGIYCTTGSLGHGLPIGLGMALSRKEQEKPGEIYVLMGDGECQEGTTWESSLIASHYKLDNLTAIIDKNGIQALNKVEDVISLGNLREKFDSFGWYTQEVDGHNIEELTYALGKREKSKPRMIIANTIKGKGVSFMENIPKWHTSSPNKEEIRGMYHELK